MADLMEILPEYFRPVRELQEIMKVLGVALDEVERVILQIGANCHIQTADEATISMYEEKLGIVYIPGDTLEYRRQRILQKLSTIVPFSLGFFKVRLSELYGDNFVLNIEPELCRMNLLITTEQYESERLLSDLLQDMVPAHLEVDAKMQSRRQFRQQLKISAGGAVGSNYMADIICGGSRRMPMKVSAGGFLRSYHTHIKSKLVE